MLSLPFHTNVSIGIVIEFPYHILPRIYYFANYQKVIKYASGNEASIGNILMYKPSAGGQVLPFR